MDLVEGMGKAQEVTLEHNAATAGVPPVTGIVWQRKEDLHMAFVDGTL